jgi:hypothetical protein
MPEPVHVFVSHHHSPEEDTFTAQVVADLVAAGADVWVDISGVPSGSFVAKISEGLAGRQWLVLVMTPASLASQWVRLEVDTAIAEHRAGRMLGVIPFVMLPCKDTDIPHLWRTFQRYDATKDYEAAHDGLLRAMGLSLPAAKDAPKSLTVDRKVRQLDKAQQKILDGLLSLTPREFENAVALLLTRSGYGGVMREEVSHASDLLYIAPDGRRTYVWCKRYKPGNPVRQQVVMEAIGTVKGKKSSQAMIVTTSEYTNEAQELASNHPDKIQLLDGEQLVNMMQRVQAE